MGFKYTQRVYDGVRNTTPPQQSVLALLAHFANDKTGECFPAIQTLADQTRLSRASVIRSLDALKGKGLLKWISGGRKKNGRTLSNLYRLEVPDKVPKHVDKVVFSSWNDGLQERDGVSLCDPHPSHSETPTRLRVRLDPVSQCDPIINKTITEQSTEHNPPLAAGGAPGRFDLGVARRNGTLGDVLKAVDAAGREMRRAERRSVVDFAMEASCTKEFDDRKAFASVMFRKSQDDCRELVFQFDSERRAGEFETVRNLPALLVSRLKSLPDRI